MLEHVLLLRAEPLLKSSSSEDQLFFTPEGSRNVHGSDVREFETVQPERDFCRREHGHLGLWCGRKNPLNADAESRAGLPDIKTPYQPGLDISDVRAVNFGKGFITLIKLEELKFGELMVQVTESDLHRGGTLHRKVEPQSLNYRASGLALAAGIEPNQSEGQR
jgi:hypothetical protein